MQHRVFGINADECEPSLYRYHLTAVLVHNGPSASSGHYVGKFNNLNTLTLIVSDAAAAVLMLTELDICI